MDRFHLKKVRLWCQQSRTEDQQQNICFCPQPSLMGHSPNKIWAFFPFLFSPCRKRCRTSVSFSCLRKKQWNRQHFDQKIVSNHLYLLFYFILLQKPPQIWGKEIRTIVSQSNFALVIELLEGECYIISHYLLTRDRSRLLFFNKDKNILSDKRDLERN